MSDSKKPSGRAKGGVAAAQSMTAEQLRERAAKGAAARWAKAPESLPVAEFGSADRPLKILDVEIPCYVLSDGTRVLTQQGFLKAIGRAPKAAGGTGASTGVDKLPSFLAAASLKSLISEELSRSTTPVKFRLPSGGTPAFGYRAEVLPQVCNVYLRARDARLLLPSQLHVAERADMLVRGLAETGIVALVDEATGYQQFRARDALQAYLDRFLRRELAAWVKTFPDEFFQQLFRLKGWAWKGTSKRPGVVGHYINDLIYDRLGPGVLEELQRKNPSDGHGRRKSRHTQWLTEDIGNPALAQHMYATIGAMRAHNDWRSFLAFFKRAYPKKGENLALALD